MSVMPSLLLQYEAPKLSNEKTVRKLNMAILDHQNREADINTLFLITSLFSDASPLNEIYQS